jgi:hypothetical protein
MTDIPDKQLVLILISLFGIWISGYYHGKWAGMQKAQKQQRDQNRMRESANRF